MPSTLSPGACDTQLPASTLRYTVTLSEKRVILIHLRALILSVIGTVFSVHLKVSSRRTLKRRGRI